MSKKHLTAGMPPAQGLYDPSLEHDACGVGVVASIKGEKNHDILKLALGSVCNLMHRGALDADAKSGDGAGVLTQIPHKFFRKAIEKMGKRLYNDNDLGVGMFFLPGQNIYAQSRCRQIAEEVIARRGLVVLGWREVPLNMNALGLKAITTCPRIEQLLIVRPDPRAMDNDAFERTLYVARNEIEDRAANDKINDLYIASFSSRTIVYKGMLTSPQLERFFRDLQDKEYETAIAVFHQRYSTNTFPTWGLAQPFRMLAHNGEINTIRGNRNWVRARENEMSSNYWKDDISYFKPVVQPGGSDSGSLDNAYELLAMSGRGVLHTLMMLVPAAYRTEINLDPAVRGFYEYHACLNEPWDGPAALAISDGRIAAACLDRNGLRPARYKITKGGIFILASETGVANIPEHEVEEKGRLAPGEAIAIDTVEKRLLRNSDIKNIVANKKPYAQWLKDGITELSDLRGEDFSPALPKPEESEEDFSKTLQSFGYNDEENKIIITAMVKNGQEPIGSMGDDTPLAVLSRKPRHLSHYFRQLFAQVTNPAIDPIREKLVMSSNVYCGRKHNWLDETPEHAHLLRMPTPVLTDGDIELIRNSGKPHLATETIPVLFNVSGGEEAFSKFSKALEEVCAKAEAAVDAGKSLLILTDRGTDRDTSALPMLLAVSSVHHHLIRVGKRMKGSIIADTAEARDVQHMATLVGFGASAVNPYLLWRLLFQMKEQGQFEGMSDGQIISNYIAAIDKGLLKIMSKMGISLLSSYQGGQVFEAVGLSHELVEKCFTSTTTFIEGITLKELAQETIERHTAGYGDDYLADPGFYRFRRNGELHSFSPPAIQSLHAYVGLKGADRANSVEEYRKFVDAVQSVHPVNIRQLLKFKPGASAIPVDEVEPIEDIMVRFTTAAMSFGALSPEAHEDLAIAMNRIGGKSNSGEGGEDKVRFTPMENGDSKNSKIKQVASGRFGVTAEYLASAQEIEIKVAQGAKPGEGGQLPGHKVSTIIARLRHSTPGVMLISPPPHHDIYSIEDLAQLIYDLKQINPRAKVCVKLVSGAGVGTIAAGVAKAHADTILVSGHDGGTGASPQSSIKYAGTAWELGVAETQQVLLVNGLRDRVTLRTDGGLRTARDIVIASMLGAEEFTFGTTALIALGCVYVRQCQLNNCPTGVATQQDKFRAKYKGSPDGVVSYFKGLAEEIREMLASLGVRNLEEIIGHPEYLEQVEVPDHPKANTLDLSHLLYVPDIDDFTPRHHTWERNDKHEDQPLDRIILQDVASTLQTKKTISLSYKIRNVNRSVGTQLSGEIAYRYGNNGLPDDTINLTLKGSAGQSLGAFLVQGVTINLLGESNDYVGKGMCGGKIILNPPRNVTFEPSENIICGNTCLYGATSGKLFANGRVGERFGVRNSGGIAVVEGLGDHGCEYMTGGTIVVLGSTGKNFGAGMSGGTGYVLDEEDVFEGYFNPAMVEIHRVEEPSDIEALKTLVEEHADATGSTKANRVLSHWNELLPKFWKVAPIPTTPPAPAPTQDQAAADAKN